MLEGRGGDDTLQSRDAAHFNFFPEADNDFYVFNGLGLGSDIINDLDGTNTLNFAGSGRAVEVNLSTQGFPQTVMGSDLQLTLNSFVLTVVGSGFGDTLKGDPFPNQLIGGGSDDYLAGDGGNDTYPFSGTNLGSDRIDDLKGDNILDFTGAVQGVNIGLGNQGTQFVNSDLRLTLNARIRTIQGSAFRDVLKGDANVNEFFGNGGDDYLAGEGNDDVLRGGAGKDELRGDDGNDRLFGGADVDKLFGGANDDYLNGGNEQGSVPDGAADELTGGPGRDTFDADYFWQWMGWYWQRSSRDFLNDYNPWEGDFVQQND
ncbi:MAG: hypothetical protein L0Z62_20175 [Gemmataceae bacterium]|nr:hypothetical protein [Gemmataceae bacterium]